MGKAKRAKLNRQLEEQRRAEAEAKRRAEKKENVKITVAVIAVILVVAIIVTTVCLIVLSVKKTGDYLRGRVSVSTENFEMNNAMISYFFADNFYMQKSYFDYYSSYFGLNTSASLKAQAYSDEMSWYDYFLNAALSNASSILISCEGAKAAGLELDDTDKAHVEKEIDALKADAEAIEMDFEDYLSEYYGLGVKESDVRDALELYYLSTKYYYYQIDGIDISDADITEHFESKENDYLRVSYKAYSVKPILESGFTEEQKAAAYADAEKYANAIAKAKDADEFDKLLNDFLTDLHKRDGSNKTTVSDILKEVAACNYEGESFVENSEYSKWLFNDDTKVGDTKVIGNNSGTYTVYMLTSAKAREEYKTHNIRHILFLESDYENKEACLAAAEKVLAEFNKGDKTEEAFGALASKYSADTGSVYTGGLYEDVAKGEMVEEFEDWSYDEKRQAGDVEIVYTDSYGYHIMFYSGEGREAWAAEVYDTLLNEAYTKLSEELTETYKANVDTKAANNIPDIN